MNRMNEMITTCIMEKSNTKHPSKNGTQRIVTHDKRSKNVLTHEYDAQEYEYNPLQEEYLIQDLDNKICSKCEVLS